MRVQVYAVLKDHFDREFQVTTPVRDAGALRDHLAQQKPAAAEILSLCRFAVNDEFITNDFQLNDHDVISIIPPASGG